METKSFNLYRYSIPVDSQLILRGRFLKRREGLIVRVSCSRDGWGEIAPLPGFSEETLEQAQGQALEWLTNWCHASCEAPRVPLDGCSIVSSLNPGKGAISPQPSRLQATRTIKPSRRFKKRPRKINWLSTGIE